LVEIVPRANWGRVMLETASDIGYLLIDGSRREVLFEGDRERMRIPSKAILSCVVQQASFGEVTAGSVEYFFTVMQVNHHTGVRELPFAYRGEFGKFGAGVRL